MCKLTTCIHEALAWIMDEEHVVKLKQTESMKSNPKNNVTMIGWREQRKTQQ